MKWSPLLIQCVVFVLFFEEMSTTNNVYGNTKVYRIVISINNHFLKTVQKGNEKINSITEISLYNNRNIHINSIIFFKVCQGFFSRFFSSAETVTELITAKIIIAVMVIASRTMVITLKICFFVIV